MHEDSIGKSAPVQLSSIMVAHAIHRDRYEVFNLLNNFNFGLNVSAAYLISFIFILVISCLINLSSLRIRFGRRGTGKISKEIVLALRSFRVNNRLSATGIFILSTHLFLWMTQLFLTNNIKVDV